MLTEDEKIRRLKSLTRKEMEVVYYFGQGMKDEEIRAKLKINVQGSLNTRRTGIYKKLRIFNKESTEVGFKVDDVEKPKCLAREYVPLIPLVCPDENALKLW